MAGMPSVGDILMLSQLAWRIGRTFTAGRKDAPTEFISIEAEVNGLSKTLKLLGEALFASPDGNILLLASDEIKLGLDKLLNTCRRTLNDLDSLVAEYQVTQKTSTGAGFTVERSWSPLVLSNYKDMMWTADGGNLAALKDILRMHRTAISLTVQALNSKSLDKLESTVNPIAEKIDLINGHVQGDLNETIEHVRQDATVNMSTPQLPAQRSSALTDLDEKSSIYGRSPQPSRAGSVQATPYHTPEIPVSETASFTSGRMGRSSSQNSGYPNSFDPRFSVFSSASSRPLTPRTSNPIIPLQSASPNFDRHTSKYRHHDIPTPMESPQTYQQEIERRSHRSSRTMMEPLPQPALPMDDVEPAMGGLSISPEITSLNGRSRRSNTSSSDQYAFEKAAFRNAAILCEVRGAAVEYTRSMSEEVDPFNIELVEAMENCRICIVRRRETSEDKLVQMVTSIWAFSNDGQVRMQHKLDENHQYVPYSSFFQQEKISLGVPSELKFHDAVYGTRLLKTTKTTWVNYIMADLRGATLFQNELMSRTLICTFKTEKTVRLHEGFSGVLAYQEQMCGMENMRIWEDETNGGIFAMIHYSAQFRIGYLAFWLNSSKHPVRVKDDGAREVKVKGLKIPIGDATNLMRKDSGAGAAAYEKSKKGGDGKKIITGAKIEFSSEADKYAFLNKVKQAQTKMTVLPDL